MADMFGNIQFRSYENETERLWRLFAEELKQEQEGFSFIQGTSKDSNNGYQQHKDARDSKFDFVFHFKDWDTQVYENIPSFKLGEFTGKLKEWKWDYNFVLNIEVKRVGMGNSYSVMPKRFIQAFNIPFYDKDNWLIVDFSNVLKLSNFGGIIHIEERNKKTVHHIFHEEDIFKACIGYYVMDWEGDPTKVGGGGYKAKTLLNKKYSVKFSSFESVKDYIRSMADYYLTVQKEQNRQLFYKNLLNEETQILPYSESKLKNAKIKPFIFENGEVKEIGKEFISCKEVISNG